MSIKVGKFKGRNSMKNTSPSELYNYKGTHIETNHSSSSEAATFTSQAARGNMEKTSLLFIQLGKLQKVWKHFPKSLAEVYFRCRWVTAEIS